MPPTIVPGPLQWGVVIDRIERHDLVNAIALAGVLLILGFLLLGARSALGSVWERGLWQAEETSDEFASADSADLDEVFGLRAPNEVSIGVGNASEVDGLASRATERLADNGYGAIPPQNKEGDLLNESAVFYVDGFKLDAIRVASLLGIEESKVRPMPDSPGVEIAGADVIVLLGLDIESNADPEEGEA